MHSYGKSVLRLRDKPTYVSKPKGSTCSIEMTKVQVTKIKKNEHFENRSGC